MYSLNNFDIKMMVKSTKVGRWGQKTEIRRDILYGWSLIDLHVKNHEITTTTLVLGGFKQFRATVRSTICSSSSIGRHIRSCWIGRIRPVYSGLHRVETLCSTVNWPSVRF
jgi:hypothetical protein